MDVVKAPPMSPAVNQDHLNGHSGSELDQTDLSQILKIFQKYNLKVFENKP